MILEPAIEKNILIVVGLIISIILGVLLFNSYLNSFELFLICINIIILLYSSLSISYVLKLQDLFSERDFNINFASDLFIASLSLLCILFFTIKYLFFISSNYSDQKYNQNYHS